MRSKLKGIWSVYQVTCLITLKQRASNQIERVKEQRDEGNKCNSLSSVHIFFFLSLCIALSQWTRCAGQYEYHSKKKIALKHIQKQASEKRKKNIHSIWWLAISGIPFIQWNWTTGIKWSDSSDSLVFVLFRRNQILFCTHFSVVGLILHRFYLSKSHQKSAPFCGGMSIEYTSCMCARLVNVVKNIESQHTLIVI